MSEVIAPATDIREVLADASAECGLDITGYQLAYISEQARSALSSTREQAVRECAEIAGTQRGETADGQYTWWEVSNNIRNRILSLIDRGSK
ncbi:hypothetical protein QFZ34_002108 [Phyllobacterium ifriqiyense]|uniref:Uncharacterized protein n=1 Tax=Phyllobacterium ifriqiyense TaxID=314238 RepID=A0ABU0S8E5_9HYPH|nr:hypothetical protein [Phyllobacterium ifriqiyense]MDQ0996926.1 hypothetical protein [Phyllobacterium ifriqiyense]